MTAINSEVDAAIRNLARRRYGTATDEGFRLVMIATRQCPYGLVRPYVGGEVPDWLDDVCIAAAAGIVALGDRPLPNPVRSD